MTARTKGNTYTFIVCHPTVDSNQPDIKAVTVTQLNTKNSLKACAFDLFLGLYDWLNNPVAAMNIKFHPTPNRIKAKLKCHIDCP